MYRDLLRESEIYQLIMAEGRELGEAKGIQDQKRQDMYLAQQMILQDIQARFPDLVSLAQARFQTLDDLPPLLQLWSKMMQAPSVVEARLVLEG